MRAVVVMLLAAVAFDGAAAGSSTTARRHHRLRRTKQPTVSFSAPASGAGGGDPPVAAPAPLSGDGIPGGILHSPRHSGGPADRRRALSWGENDVGAALPAHPVTKEGYVARKVKAPRKFWKPWERWPSIVTSTVVAPEYGPNWRKANSAGMTRDVKARGYARAQKWWWRYGKPLEGIAAWPGPGGPSGAWSVNDAPAWTNAYELYQEDFKKQYRVFHGLKHDAKYGLLTGQDATEIVRNKHGTPLLAEDQPSFKSWEDTPASIAAVAKKWERRHPAAFTTPDAYKRWAVHTVAKMKAYSYAYLDTLSVEERAEYEEVDMPAAYLRTPQDFKIHASAWSRLRARGRGLVAPAAAALVQ